MKTRFFFLLLAAVLLGSVSVKAQSETPLKGDVNGDGKVDVADIVAILEIMKNSGGTTEETTYYWYVGQTDPSTMTEISPIVTDTSSPGWRLIGNTIPTYTFENPLYNASVNPIVSNPSKNDYWYVAFPMISLLSIYNSLQGNEITSGNWIKQSTNLIIDNVEYNIYKIVATQRKFTGLWVH